MQMHVHCTASASHLVQHALHRRPWAAGYGARATVKNPTITGSPGVTSGTSAEANSLLQSALGRFLSEVNRGERPGVRSKGRSGIRSQGPDHQPPAEDIRALGTDFGAAS